MRSCYTYARATRAVSVSTLIVQDGLLAHVRLSPSRTTPMYVCRLPSERRSKANYQLIATKARDFVYNDDTSDTATTLSSELSGPRGSTSYDALKLKKRLEANPMFNEVGWYM